MTNEIIKAIERKNPESLGIFDETAPLKKVLMWGPPGAEAALALLLPEEKSCFWETFDVMGARREFRNALQLIQTESPQTEIVLLKDKFAEKIFEKGISSKIELEELLDRLGKKAEGYYQKHKLGDLDQVKIWVYQCVFEDVQKYGEKAAVVMNERLSLGEELPMANVLYARDQSNMIGKLMVWSSMRHPIRQPEVALYREILDSAGILPDDIEQVQVTGDGRFEGGDVFVTDGVCYIGIGGRTNWEGVNQIAPHILKQGLRVVVAWDRERDENRKGEMDAMHLDTYVNLFPGGWVGCLEEMNRRHLTEIVVNGNGRINKPLGNFRKYLLKSGLSFVSISKPDQEKHAANFTNLGGGKILLTRSTPDLDQRLKDRGLNIISADFQNIGNGAGGTHCSMAPIWRG